MSSRAEIFDLGVLPDAEDSRLLLVDGVGVDDDGFLLVFGSCVDLGTVASLGFVSADIIKYFPIFLR